MMKKNELREFNEKTFDEHCNSDKHFQLGFFKGNHILCIGIRPGTAYNEKTKEDTVKVQSQQTFESFEKEYIKLIKKSKIGEFVSGICGENYNHISFTNVCKVASDTNEEPTQQEKEEGMKILSQHIEFINPNVIVLFGNFVGECFGITEKNKFILKDGNFYVLVDHPAYSQRSGTITKEINKVKEDLDNFFKLHAITKVTKRNIYYRNTLFEKCCYENTEDDSYCFIECIEESALKSFDRKNLKKISRNEIPMSPEQKTYEEHLNKKDLFYYNHIDREQNTLSHSKMLRCMYLDIETNFGKDIKAVDKEITAISFYDTLSEKYYTYYLLNRKKEKINAEKFKDVYLLEFEDEKLMLMNFLKNVNKFDLITGWYSSGFDIPYIFNRSRKLGINLHDYFKNFFFGEDEKTQELRLHNDSIIFYDSLSFYREKGSYYSKPPSYSLGDVAKHLGLGEKLVHSGLEKLWDEDLNLLLEYNIHDVRLLKGIIEIGSIVDYPLQLQQLIPQDFENVFYNSRAIENLLHHRYWKQKIYFPTKKTQTKPEFEGALVLDPVPGIHENVAVFDFSAMYTNIIMNWNLSTEMLIGEKSYVENNFFKVVEDLRKKYPELQQKNISLTNLILIKNDFGEFYFMPKNYIKGILPLLEEEMIQGRRDLVKLRDKYVEGSPLYKVYDSIQGTRKQILNSIFGVNGYDRFIMFDPRVASSILSVARQMISWSGKIAESKGFKTLYSDTDSAFISLGQDLSFEEFISKAEKLEEELNASLRDFVRGFTGNTEVINTHSNKIEFEKAYSKLLLTEVKKRYFGFLKFYKGKILDAEKMSVTGFETRRQDTPIYFNKVLLEIYKLLLEKDNKYKIREYYRKVRDEIKTINVEDLIIKIKLSENIEDYQNLPIHVRAAKNSGGKIRRGELVKMIYVKDAREVLHYDETFNLKFELDYNKYLENFFINKVNLIDKNFSIHPTLEEFGV